MTDLEKMIEEMREWLDPNGRYADEAEPIGMVRDWADRLTALSQALPQWQPMETAPRESGRFIIICDEDGCVAEAMSRSTGGYWWWVSNNTPVRRPKWWMPLPPPPAVSR
jgi:hypothetical protein